MRVLGWMATAAMLSLAPGALAQSIANPEQAWQLASRAGVEPRTWVLLSQTTGTAMFVRKQTEREHHYWATFVYPEQNLINTSLYEINCPDRTADYLHRHDVNFNLDGEPLPDRRLTWQDRMMRNGSVGDLLDHVCGPDPEAEEY